MKDTDMSYLAIILRGIYKGEHYINSKIMARAFQIFTKYYQKASFNKEIQAAELSYKKNKLNLTDFSKSELKILSYITKGYSSKDIAKSLYLKEGTVRNYVSSIMKKTGLKERTQIVLYAQQYGFDTAPGSDNFG
jgi:DNA-binding NarL/FixJ family response regulator